MVFPRMWLGRLCGAILVTAVLVSCSQPTSTSGGGSNLPKTIGFSQKSVGAAGSWRAVQTKSIQDAITGQGTTLVFSAGDGTHATQVNAVRSFIAQKVDVIVLDCYQASSWDSVLGEAKTAGIPVVFVDTGATVSDSSLYKSFVGSDHKVTGKQVAVALENQFSSGGLVLEILGPAGNQASTDRQSGFEAELSAHGGFTLVSPSLTGSFTKSDAKTAMATYISGNPSPAPVAIFAANDEMALGAIEAITAVSGGALKIGTTNVVVVSVDGEKTALQSVKDGKLLYTYDCNPLEGPLVIDVCNKIHAGTSVDAFVPVTGERGYKQADVTDALIAARAY